MHLILNLDPNMAISTGGSIDTLDHLLLLASGIEIDVKRGASIFQLMASYQVYLLRYYFVLCEAIVPPQNNDEIVKRCIQLAHASGGLLSIIKSWVIACQHNASQAYIRNAIKLYQKLSFLASNMNSKMCLLGISLKFVDCSDLSTEKRLDYYLVALSETKCKELSQSEDLSVLTNSIVTFLEERIFLCQVPLNWRWLYLLDFTMSSRNLNPGQLLSDFRHGAPCKLITLLPAISQFVLNIYLQVLFFERSTVPSGALEPSQLALKFENVDDSLFNDSTSYLLFRLFSILGSNSRKHHLQPILFASDAFLASPSLIGEGLSCPYHNKIAIKGILTIMDGLYQFALEAHGCPDIQTILQKLNALFFLMHTKEVPFDIYESYFKRLLHL